MTTPIAEPRLIHARRLAGEWFGLAAAHGLMFLILTFGHEPGEPPVDDDI
jgi:hypothetical protein